MCTKGRRIEIRSVLLTEPNQNYPQTFLSKSSPANLEYKPRGLVTEINVCKAIRQKIYGVFYKMKCSKCSNV